MRLTPVPHAPTPTTIKELWQAHRDAVSTDAFTALTLLLTSLESMLRSGPGRVKAQLCADAMAALKNMDLTIAAGQYRARDAWSKFSRCMVRALAYPKLNLLAFDMLARHLSRSDIVGALRDALSFEISDTNTLVGILKEYYADPVTTRILANTVLDIAVYHPNYEGAFIRLCRYDALLLDECGRDASRDEQMAISLMEHRLATFSTTIPMKVRPSEEDASPD